MAEPQIVSLWSAPQQDRASFLGSGLLLDGRHVLTVKHMFTDADQAFVGLIAGRSHHTGAAVIERHPQYDAALLRLEADTPIAVEPPTLATDYTPLTGRPVTLHVVSPINWDLQKIGSYSIASYDTVRHEYQLSPENARGHSGGVVVADGSVVGLLFARAADDPLCVAVALHQLVGWIGTAVAQKSVPAPTPREARELGPPAPPGEPGFSRKLGSIHLHVDGAHAQDFVYELVERHRRAGYRAELAGVDAFVAGPQRKELRGAYGLHTPGGPEQEELDYFSTTVLHDGPGLPQTDQLYGIWKLTHDALVGLHTRGEAMRHVVVELERVVGTVEVDGAVAVDPVPRLPERCLDRVLGPMVFAPFNSRDTNRMDAATFEFHFSLDIDRLGADDTPPVELDYLLDLSGRAGLRVGGWFLFHDTERWAYRSNSFGVRCDADVLQRMWQALRTRLDAEPTPRLRGARLRLLAEEAVAVWRTGLVKRIDDDLTVPELARWEGQFPGLEEFWVAVPNFLGDQDGRVEAAMLANLNTGVKYVYFLRSNADAKRWLAFKARLEERIGTVANSMAAYVVGFRQPNEWDNGFAFIANPRSATPAAVGLRVDPLMRQVYAGTKMSPGKTAAMIAALKPALDGGAIAQWHPVLPSGPAADTAAVCVHLRDMPDDALWDSFDSEVAIEASMCDGEVVLYGTKSIIVAFRNGREGLNRALRCACRIAAKATASRWSVLGVRLGVDYAEARQVARACGLLWTGPAVRGCRDVLDCAPDEAGVFLTPMAAQVYGASAVWRDIDVRALKPGVFEVTSLCPTEAPAPAGSGRLVVAR